jgi:hypothetical protein
MISWILLAAEAAEEEHSKTAFYVAGGILAVWAVLISGLGIARPSFPSGTGGRAAVIGLTAVLVVGATSTAIITG